MTEYELMELIQSIYDKMGNDATMYFTLVSAFLAVAFFVGSRLSRIQLLIISTLYVLWVMGSMNSMFTSMRLAGKLENALTLMGSNYYGDYSTEFWVIGFMLLQLVGIFASLYFMWSARNPKIE